MRRMVLLLLALAACGEPSAARLSPTDRFVFPAAVALTARQGVGHALLVASGNYDLNYDGSDGGTVLSVDPSPYVAADGSGGSAGRPGGALVKLGDGAHVGSFAGQMVVVDSTTCPVAGATATPPVPTPVEALVATRFADQIWRLPLDQDGHLGPCAGAGCTVPADARLRDPFGLALACRPDGARRSAFVSYLRTSDLGGATYQGYLAEIDLDAPAAPARPLLTGPAGLSGLAYDAQTDRIFATSELLGAAPVYILDLPACPASQAGCPEPAASVVNLWPSRPGLDLQSIALSNPQAGLARRAYVTARVYDSVLASIIMARPSGDLASVLLVLDAEDDLTGHPSFNLLRVVPIGMGPSQVVVLPARDPDPVSHLPRRDVVLASSGVDGVVSVYDDEQGRVAHEIPIDVGTGAPEAGRAPFGMAAELLGGAPKVARVYVAAVQQHVVGIVDVPLDSPGQAHALRDAGGALIRIGGFQ